MYDYIFVKILIRNCTICIKKIVKQIEINVKNYECKI